MQVEFRVHGRVQGIGYRYFVRREAQDLGLAGWVSNEPDGTVSGLAGGDLSRLEAFRDILEHGHAFARVLRLDWWPVDGGQSLPLPFTIRP